MATVLICLGDTRSANSHRTAIDELQCRQLLPYECLESSTRFYTKWLCVVVQFRMQQDAGTDGSLLADRIIYPSCPTLVSNSHVAYVGRSITLSVSQEVACMASILIG